MEKYTKRSLEIKPMINPTVLPADRVKFDSVDSEGVRVSQVNLQAFEDNINELKDKYDEIQLGMEQNTDNISDQTELAKKIGTNVDLTTSMNARDEMFNEEQLNNAEEHSKMASQIKSLQKVVGGLESRDVERTEINSFPTATGLAITADTKTYIPFAVANGNAHTAPINATMGQFKEEVDEITMSYNIFLTPVQAGKEGQLFVEFIHQDGQTTGKIDFGAEFTTKTANVQESRTRDITFTRNDVFEALNKATTIETMVGIMFRVYIQIATNATMQSSPDTDETFLKINTAKQTPIDFEDVVAHTVISQDGYRGLPDELKNSANKF